MKLILIRICVIRTMLVVLFSVSYFFAFGQPDFRFQGGVLISGTNNQVGAVYKYSNVRTGVDAKVTIAAISSGITVTEMDGVSGYNEALQPTLTANAKVSGYMEMYFEFLVAGSNTPYTSPMVYATCIDVDGSKNNDGSGNPVYEFDEVNVGGGAVDFTTFGGELILSQSGNWFKGKNISGIDYPGRDTTAKVVMFTTYNANVSTFTIRVGIDNQSNTASTRLRSVYFKKFTYSHFPLPLPKISEFSGNNMGNNIKLNWKMESGGDWDQCILERADVSGRFEQIALYLPSDALATGYSYTDQPESAGNYYYRLKLLNNNGETKYSSILAFKTGNEPGKQHLVVYPTLAADQFTVKLDSEKNEQARLQMADYSGRLVYNRLVNIQRGINNISVNDFSVQRGNYIVVVRSGEKMYSQKIVIQ